MKKEQTFYDKVPFECEERKNIWYTKLNKILNLSSFKNKQILDIGCGTGIISDIFQKEGAEVYSIDISKKEIELAKKRNPLLHVFVTDALNLPFSNNKFDMVISLGVLHHTKNCRKGFKEAVRVTKKDGKLLIYLYNKYHPYNWIYKLAQLFTKNKDPTKIPCWLIIPYKYFLIFLGKKVTYQEVNNHLADLLYTPIATFHSKREVEKWAQEEGLELLSKKLHCLGQSRIYYFKKIR